MHVWDLIALLAFWPLLRLAESDTKCHWECLRTRVWRVEAPRWALKGVLVGKGVVVG